LKQETQKNPEKGNKKVRLNESETDLSVLDFDDGPMTVSRDVYAESRNSITVLLEEYAGCRNESGSTFMASRESFN
jgi:hypothetical protein